NMFNKTSIPEKIREEIKPQLTQYNEKKTAVRSSSAAEDSGQTSFAGLHESYVNVSGIEEILEKTRLVWASLWSDAALLYRQELGLSVDESTMPVVIQEMIQGDVSGVAFSKSPNNPEEMMIEAVYGLCKGLVDGKVEPDRWTIKRENMEITSHFEPIREISIIASENGSKETNLTETQRHTPPIDNSRLTQIANLVIKLEKIFGKPQDVEWTIKEDEIYIIQARPITTIQDKDDIRNWYLSLRRSLDNLIELEKRITKEIIPEMIDEANQLEKTNLTQLNNPELIEEINHRAGRMKHWHDIYWDEFIPMAHGTRIFGQIYNDRVKPDDSYEFTKLLSGTNMLSLKRNNRITEIARKLSENPPLKEKILQGSTEEQANKLKEEITELFARYNLDIKSIIGLMDEIQDTDKELPKKNEAEKLTEKYLKSFEKDQQNFAEEALRLGRSSWKLRDDDNILLGKYETLLKKALDEAKKRLLDTGVEPIEDMLEDEIILSLLQEEKVVTREKREHIEEEKFKPRQLVGQPAVPGLITGKARVINEESDLFKFKKGEILVCDSIDPNMTFIVPLANGIIERRGGMLIHGAIIAREYGIPCVTGIPNATKVVETGDSVTVDGYLGLVIINQL
ncbi:MAG: PEP/pyruvate-binding domain-containing protein, partial [Candidatus Wukongarchaeota archaeon]|nr:PEP/pyruvate-binding domain-containing protein [Candidatus Wukongarchaeota archaeon]